MTSVATTQSDADGTQITIPTWSVATSANFHNMQFELTVSEIESV